MEQKILEEDMYKPIYDLLTSQGYIVRSEVQNCDITAIKDNELVIIEMKKNLSVKLLTQAVQRQKVADNVYIAIPKPKKFRMNNKWKDIIHLIKRLELGLILIDFKNDESIVEVVVEPNSFDRQKSFNRNKKKRHVLIKEIQGRKMELNLGGSSRKKLVTAYREEAIFIACCLKKYGALSTKELRKLGTHPKKTTNILYNNYYGWFERVELGIYKLTKIGELELESYKELVQYFNKKLEKKE